MIKIQRGIEYMKESHSACVIFSGEEIVYESKARGIFPLYEAHEMLRIDLEGCVLFDRIIGKAAAMIACDAGMTYVYGKVMSEHASKYLDDAGIPYSYEIKTEYIKNRGQNGMCPV